MIPKKMEGELRPLTVIAPYDKIVSSAIKIVLNLIYEEHQDLNMLEKRRYFQNTSHGFRPNRGCHSALSVTRT